jgi:predicted anti-sigma-YlaC factor YlaD
MKISCEIIKDLLPLYHDGVCSNDSKMMVDGHLADCDSCKAELQAMDDELPINNADYAGHYLNEAEAVKKLSRRWKKGMRKSLLKGALIAILIIALVILVIYSFMDVRILPKPN